MQHPRRNEVYRDVGSEPHEPDDPLFIDVFRQPFEPDAALFLCSDGLTDAGRRRRSRKSSDDFAGHPFEIVRGLIDAANAAGGKDNVTVVYAEGPRFAVGEDTRDLRAHRAPVRRRDQRSLPAGAVRDAAGAIAEPRGGVGIAALVGLLLTLTGLAAYWQRDRVALARPVRALRVCAGGRAGATGDRHDHSSRPRDSRSPPRSASRRGRRGGPGRTR